MNKEWMSALRAIPIEWLLGEDNPPVRYYTMRDLLEYSRRDSDLLEARENVPQYRPIQRILQKQSSEGHWISESSPYLPKYKASYWQVMLLGIMGIDRSHPEVECAVEHILKFQHSEGGFAEYMEAGARDEYDYLQKRAVSRGKPIPVFAEWAPSHIREMQLSCLTGNMALALIRLGYAEHESADRALLWLAKIQNEDGGWLCPYWGSHKHDKHGCFMGTITPLEAFSEAPQRNLESSIKRVMSRGAEFLLMHHLYRADHHDYEIINERWLRLGFPQFFYDILRGLSVITKLGHARDPRLADALHLLLSKQQEDGKWLLESTLTGRMHATIEHKGKPSKWVTLEALRVIKRVIEQTGDLSYHGNHE